MSSIEPTIQGAESQRFATPSPDALRREIVAANARFMDAFRNGDAGAIAACYTFDAQLLPPNGDVVAGTEAIGQFWGGVLGLGIAGVRLDTAEVEGGSDFAVEVGRFALTTADGAEADRGKYVVVWRRADGAWKLHRDIWNSSRPAQGG